MSQVLKNSVMLGAMIIFCYFFYGVASTFNNYEILENAKQHAADRGADNAKADLAKGTIQVMFVSGGFSGDYVPTIGLEKYQRCFSRVASLKKYDSIGCVPFTKSYDEIVKTYRETPQYTDVYAETYNFIIQTFLENSDLGICN